MLILLILLNFAISVFNSWSVGRSWAETKAAGGWARFLAYCGAIMAASGFTWCYTIILAVVASLMGKLPEPYVEGMLRLGYLIIILPVIGSGIAIMVDSWAHFWRKRSFGSGAVAGWNTFANVYNVVQALDAVPESLSFIGDLFSGKGTSKKDGAAFLLMCALVALALLGGILTAVCIIRMTARKHAQSVSWGMAAKMEAAER